MSEIVSGWSDDDHVYLVVRDGDSVSARRIRSKWSAFFLGLNDNDRAALARSRDVVHISVDGAGYTRADFRNRMARREVVSRVAESIKVRKMDAVSEDDVTKLFKGGIFEADVGPLRRHLSDNPQIQIGTPRAVYLDLETDSRKRFDDMTVGKARILAWALYRLSDTNEAEFVSSMALGEDTDHAERELLSELFEELAAFDLVLSWNGHKFDFPVLEMRAQRILVRVNGKPPIWNRWSWLDHMEVFKKYNQAHDSGEERSSFALDAIGHHLLGEGKIDFDALKTWQAWEAGGETREEMLRYCEHDTALMARIEAQTGFVALHIAVCQVTRCFPDTMSLGAAAQGDGFLLALGGQRGFRFPTKRYDDAAGDEAGFAGAYVMPPKRIGVMDHVHVCDFAGLYPSIMRSWNMSLETYVTPVDAARGDVPVAKLPIARAVSFRTDKRGIFPEALDLIVSERAKYTKRSDDAEPGSPDWHRYRRLSSAYKIIANSFYGIVGSPFTRFFDREVAEGVTQTGAWLIKHVAATVEASGRLESVYGDTDSVFVTGAGDVQAEEAVELFGRIIATLNAQWPEILRRMGCTESRIKLEFEKSFRRLVLVSAKRYAARYSRYKGKPAPVDMKPEVKGLEYKRGDALRLAREMQRETIDILLDVDRPPPGPEVFREIVAKWRNRILKEPLSVEDILLSQSVKDLGDYRTRYTTQHCSNKVAGTKKACGYGFGSTDWLAEDGDGAKCPRCGAKRKIASLPMHVRVAKLLEERGVQVTEGTRVEYLVIGRGEDDNETTLNPIPAHDPGALELIDRDYYWDKRVLPPTARLLEAVFHGESWKETASSRRRASMTPEELKASRARPKASKKAPQPSQGAFDLGTGDAPSERAGGVQEARGSIPTPSQSPTGPAGGAFAPKPSPAAPKKRHARKATEPVVELGYVLAVRWPDLPPPADVVKVERLIESIRAITALLPGGAVVKAQLLNRASGELIQEFELGAVKRSAQARSMLERVVGVGNARDEVA